MGNDVETKLLQIDPKNFSEEALKLGIHLLKIGEVVAFPTETVYGLGASAYSFKGIQKIFQVKGRPMDNPLIVHISSMEMLKDIISISEIPPNVESLCKAFWPGPLTILFPKAKKILSEVTAHLPTMAVRMPNNPITLKLIELTGVPIAAPSANISGSPSPTTAKHVFHDFNGKIPLIIDGGPCPVGVESTVIDLNRDPPLILRPGGLNFEQLRQYLPTLQIYDKMIPNKELQARPCIPGLKYRHYSPSARVILIEFRSHGMENLIIEKLDEMFLQKSRCGYIHTQVDFTLPQQYRNQLGENFIDLTRSDSEIFKEKVHLHAHIAQHLFSALRKLDDQEVEYILICGISEDFEGLAVMNRLNKAASEIL
ncbi:MAG: L-threonylcarbamoyladenylate synthase [Promethearchaeota archaeon]